MSYVDGRPEWREDKVCLRCFAPEGLQDSAQGFNPGKRPVKRFALKGREIAWSKCAPNATEKE
jgi:hypothetical protein